MTVHDMEAIQSLSLNDADQAALKSTHENFNIEQDGRVDVETGGGGGLGGDSLFNLPPIDEEIDEDEFEMVDVFDYRDLKGLDRNPEQVFDVSRYHQSMDPMTPAGKAIRDGVKKRAQKFFDEVMNSKSMSRLQSGFSLRK